jgi:SAM-dependent methyltransferase
MHDEVRAFLRSTVEVPWASSSVVEVGSADWNGRAVDCVPALAPFWQGIDLVEGANVDMVGDACMWLPLVAPVDVVVSTEVLEHAENWAELLASMCNALRRGGWLVLTCAGTGRQVHSADGGPRLKDGEHYRNVTLAEVAAICAEYKVAMIRGEEGPPGDTRFLGRKESAWRI